MATPKSTPEERAQAAQLVLTRVESGETLADSIRHFARLLEVSEDSLRRWVRQEKAKVEEPAAAAPVVVDPIDQLVEQSRSQAMVPRQSGGWQKYRPAVVIVAAVIAALVSAGVVKGLTDSPSDKARARVADYIAGKGAHEFVASDSKFRATFPFGAPKRETQTQTIGPFKVEYVNYGTERDSGAFMVGSFALPAGVPYDLNAGVNGAAVAVDGHIESATPTTHEGHPAIEFVISGKQGGRPYLDKGLMVDARERVYILQAIWEDGAAPGYDAFKASFHIG